MISAKVKKFLDRAGAKYELLDHKIVYTAYDKAATLCLKEEVIAKTLVVRLDKEIALVVIPASYNLDKNKLKQIINASRKKYDIKTVKSVDFVKEQWIKNNIKGVKVGAVQPFGNLFKIATFVDARLLKNPKIVINSGNYGLSIRLSSAVYKKLIPDMVAGYFGKKR